MYTLVSALVLGKNLEAQYQTAIIGDKPLYSIFSSYDKIYLTLSNPVLTNNVYVDFNSYKNELFMNPITLNQWLIQIGNTTLNIVDHLPTENIKYIRYSDGFQNGYKVDKPILDINVPSYFNINDHTTAILTRDNPNTDLRLIDQYCLVTVNGFIHNTSSTKKYTGILDGMTTLRKSNANQCGIISFKDIGRIAKIPININNIYKNDINVPYKDKLYFHIDQQIGNQSFILVLGGYLVFLQPNVFWQVGPNDFALDFNFIPILDRYFESKDNIDLSHLGLTSNISNPDNINVNELLSDSVLTKYLTMDKSFLLTINTPSISLRKHYIKPDKVPTMFTAYERPRYPLIVNNGKIAEYWSIGQDGQWSITVTDSFLKYHTFNLTLPNDLGVVSRKNVPNYQYTNSNAFFLEIASGI